MARPQFSEMLSGRRRQLGLSIAQASRVLKLKEQVLIAFEEGDWDRIPRSGYAQGMLSSYARYLGLNPRDVIDQFQDDLMRYTSGVDHYKDPYDTGVGAVRSRGMSGGSGVSNSGYGQDKDLYGSAGPAGSILTGHELGQPRRSTRSIPLASTRNAGYSERYLRAQNNEREATSQANAEYPQGRPYTGRAPQRSQDRSRTTRRNYERTNAGRERESGFRNDITTRRVSSSTYADDLTYAEARPYEQASSREGRAASRNIAPAQRPNVRRRSSDAARKDMQRRPNRRQRSGVLGVLDAYFSNRTRTIFTIFAALAVVIIVVLVLSVKACNSSTVAEESKANVTVAQSSATSTDSSSATSSTSTTDTEKDTSSTTSTTTDDTTPVTVTVTVGSGEVSWLEIVNGDESLVADTVSGPWEQTYTVSGEMTIEASDITAVTVLKNGVQVPFDERASGVGSITIEGPKTTADATATSEDDADAEAEGASTTSDTSSSTTGTATTSSSKSTTTTSTSTQ